MSNLTNNSRRTANDGVRSLSASELHTVAGGVALNPFTNEGCIRIIRGPGPVYNPWLDPSSPERRMI